MGSALSMFKETPLPPVKQGEEPLDPTDTNKKTAIHEWRLISYDPSLFVKEHSGVSAVRSHTVATAERKRLQKSGFWADWDTSVDIGKIRVMVAHTSGLIFPIFVKERCLIKYRHGLINNHPLNYWNVIMNSHAENELYRDQLCVKKPYVPKASYKKYDLRSKVGGCSIQKRKHL